MQNISIENILITALIYLIIPIIIRLIFRNGFDYKKSFFISVGNFLLMKLILSIILKVEFNIYSAWLYIFIADAILAIGHKNKGNPYSRPLDEIIKDISNKDN